MAFLNETGLATFLSYLKAWARSVFASKTDTQTIEGATTFSQTIGGSISGNAATATKLATARTINGVAFDGSANITVADSTKVSKTGNETVAGQKTFTDPATISRGTPILNLTNTDNTSYGDIRFIGDNTTRATIRANIGAGNLGIGNAYNKSGYWFDGALLQLNNNGSFTLRAKDGTNESSLGGSPSGSLTWSGAAPAASDDSTKIATTAWVRDATGNFACNAATATKLGTSTVGSANNPIYLNGGTPTATDSVLIKRIKQSVGDGNYTDIIQTIQSDNNDYRSCTIRCYNGNGYNDITLGAHDEVNSAPSGISVRNTAGTVTAYAPNPANDANDTRIATTKWVKDRGYITSSGSITGNAATATAFSASKSVTLTGAVIGTASSTGGWSIPTTLKTCIGVCEGEARTDCYYKIASGSISGVYNHHDIVILIQDVVSGARVGLWHIHLNAGSTGGVFSSGSSRFLCANGLNTNTFYVVYKSNSGSTVNYELWVYLPSRYTGYRFTVLSEAQRTNKTVADLLTLVDADTTGGSTSLPSGYTALTTTYDVSVTQNVSTANNTYPILLCPTANATANQGDKTSIFPKSVKVNPSTNALYADRLYATSDKVISGNGLYDTTNTGSMFICGGSSISTSSHINITGYQNTGTATFLLRAFSPSSQATSTYADLSLGYAGTLKWNGQTVQTSSDERLKTPISPVDDGVLDAWADVSWGQFKFLDAVETKGDDARFHVGLIAQKTDRACKNRNVDIRRYGILCHDEWEDEYVEEDGEQVLYTKGGDLWMIRYTEALCMEAAYMRRENARLKARIAALEERLNG